MGQHGKPRLAGTTIDDGLVFNVSHSGALALVVISKNRALGIDVEKINNRHNLQGMAQRCFSKQELSSWNQLTEPCKTNQFYEYLCAKEALLKATGRGLALGMQQCVIDLDQPAGIVSNQRMALQRVEVGDSYRAFVAGNSEFLSVINKQFAHCC